VGEAVNTTGFPIAIEIVTGVKVTDDRTAMAVTIVIETLAVFETPFRLAVTFRITLPVTAPAVKLVKGPELWLMVPKLLLRAQE
jgi:hypothetical protein